MNYRERKPVKRSKARAYFGQRYYTLKKYFEWNFGGKVYVKHRLDKQLEHIIFTHKTPLLRKLKDVDMYLQHNKITNLKLAVEKLNGIVIRPGETFSYWKLIGKPSYKKGYMDGLVLCPDGSFKPGVGGGLCQLSNLIYWMTLHSPLSVKERYRHSHDVFPDVNRTQPFGTGATCSYNYLDLQLYNDTIQDYQLCLRVTEHNLEGEWRSVLPSRYRYEVYEKEHQITAGMFGGYVRNNSIWRRVYSLEGELIKDEYIAENHAYMTYAPFIGEAADLKQKSVNI